MVVQGALRTDSQLFASDRDFEAVARALPIQLLDEPAPERRFV